MKLKTFRIYNYKSIKDSGVCSLSSDFTILIGKNESGKTAILEALQDFDRQKSSLSKDTVPLSSLNEEPLLELTFDINEKELDAVTQQIQYSMEEAARYSILTTGLTLTKSFSGEYKLKGHEIKESLFEQPTVPKEFEEIKIKEQKLKELLGPGMPELKFESPQAMKDGLKELRSFTKSRLLIIPDEGKKTQAVEQLHEINRAVNEAQLSIPVNHSSNPLVDALVRSIPRFVLFSDFKDILPFEVPVEALKTNEIVADFARLAKLDVELFLKVEDLQKRINILNRSSAVINSDLMERWQQEKTELMARPEGNKLIFGIKEAEGVEFFKVEQRSQGFRWFLSFSMRLSRYKDQQVIILIDEPGLNLHLSVQKDILEFLSKESTAQVIFSTHSSGLIDPGHLDRLRFIIKEKQKGTIIKDSSHTGIDPESLMPLMVAISAQLPKFFLTQDSNTTVNRQVQLFITQFEKINGRIKEERAPVVAPIVENIEKEPQLEEPKEEKSKRNSILDWLLQKR